MGSATRLLMPPKARLQALVEEVNRLEARVHASSPIAVFRVARCGHLECGCQLPAEMPSDALVIELGCRYQIPSIEPPEGQEGGYRSRVERGLDHGVGRGLGPERLSSTIRLISRLQLLSE
jgi:hypothetical protein